MLHLLTLLACTVTPLDLDGVEGVTARNIDDIDPSDPNEWCVVPTIDPGEVEVRIEADTPDPEQWVVDFGDADSAETVSRVDFEPGDRVRSIVTEWRGNGLVTPTLRAPDGTMAVACSGVAPGRVECVACGGFTDGGYIAPGPLDVYAWATSQDNQTPRPVPVEFYAIAFREL